ncbi:MAG TPA: Yip1 family protein [Gemmatimonadales bacterium]|nr:Yip1 family protein [Gemmatimonadales bacterium]
METLTSRVKAILLEPRTTWREIDTEFTKPGAVWARYVFPLASLGALARTIGMIIFGKQVALTSLTNPVGLSTAVVSGVVVLVVAILSVFLLSKIISLLAPGFGGNANDVQALKAAAYSSTAAWIGSVFALIPALNLVSVFISLYSVVLLYLGLPIVMKVPKDRAMGYTAVVIIVAIVVFVIGQAVISG